MNEIYFSPDIVELDVDLEVVTKFNPVFPNPAAPATECLRKVGISGTCYQVYPDIPTEEGVYSLDLQVTSEGYRFYWRKQLTPSENLYPNTTLFPN